MPRIPLAVPDLSEREERYVVEAVRSSWISSTGAFVDRFEREFAALCEGRAAVSVANGTVGLHLAVEALGIDPGDEVIVPSLTYVATANAVRYAGGRPVFVDVDPATWCLDPAAVEQAVTDRTRGIIAVHLYGHPAPMDDILGVASAAGIWVVEDAAEAHLARYKGRRVGGLANVGVFSFYGNKILTSGEGGALIVNDHDLERRIRLLRGQGMSPDRRYYFPVVGYNYRLTNVQCALLCGQVERASGILERREEIARTYRTLLAGIDGIGFQPVAEWASPAPWLFSVTVEPSEFGQSRDELIESLDAMDIETRPFFIPIHTLPPYRSSAPMDLPITDSLAQTGINLPTYSQMSNADIAAVVDGINRARSSRTSGP